MWPSLQDYVCRATRPPPFVDDCARDRSRGLTEGLCRHPRNEKPDNARREEPTATRPHS